MTQQRIVVHIISNNVASDSIEKEKQSSWIFICALFSILIDQFDQLLIYSLFSCRNYLHNSTLKSNSRVNMQMELDLFFGKSLIKIKNQSVHNYTNMAILPGFPRG